MKRLRENKWIILVLLIALLLIVSVILIFNKRIEKIDKTTQPVGSAILKKTFPKPVSQFIYQHFKKSL